MSHETLSASRGTGRASCVTLGRYVCFPRFPTLPHYLHRLSTWTGRTDDLDLRDCHYISFIYRFHNLSTPVSH